MLASYLTYPQEDVQEDFGWKLVHGEVFRSPRYSMMLSVFVGNGAQVCAMTGVTLGLLHQQRSEILALTSRQYLRCSDFCLHQTGVPSLLL